MLTEQLNFILFSLFDIKKTQKKSFKLKNFFKNVFSLIYLYIKTKSIANNHIDICLLPVSSHIFQV